MQSCCKPGLLMDLKWTSRSIRAIKDKEIPSLSLQLLVENAVKHNIISKQQPVHVRITSTPAGYLTVTNNFRKKTKSSVESTGIGLANIREKYKLLNRFDVKVEETADQFKVTYTRYCHENKSTIHTPEKAVDPAFICI